MSLLFFDGFDGYDAAADLTSFGGWASTATVSLSSSVRVGSGKSMVVGTSAGGTLGSAIFMLASDKYNTDLFIGFALNLAGSQNSATLLFFNNSAGVEQCSLHISQLSSTTYKLVARRSTIVLAAGTTVLSAGAAYWVELKLKINDTTGIFDCKIEGIPEFTFSGNTRSSASLEMKGFKFSSISPSNVATGYFIDDLYVCDSAGSQNNTYLGEVRAQIIKPSSDSSVAWTPNAGASNWDAVDDNIGAPDDDTTYVSSSTPGTKDEYGLSDLSGVNAVAGVRLVTRAKKDDANPRSFKHGIKSGSTDQQVTYALGIGYSKFIDIFETSDGAGTPFTATTVNSLLSTLEVA